MRDGSYSGEYHFDELSGENIFLIRSTCTILEQVGKVKCTASQFNLLNFLKLADCLGNAWHPTHFIKFLGKCILSECLLDCHRSTKNVSTKLHISKDCISYSFHRRLVRIFVWSESKCKVLTVTVRLC